MPGHTPQPPNGRGGAPVRESGGAVRVLIAVGVVTVTGLLVAIGVLVFTDLRRSVLPPTKPAPPTATTFTPAAATVETTPVEVSTAATLTVEQQRAADVARDQILFGPRSRAQLIEYLTTDPTEGTFSKSDATVAVDSLHIDWVRQATKQAESYLAATAFSRRRLLDRLEEKGFTTDQSTRAVDGLGVDWVAQARRSAIDWAESTSVSRKFLVRVMAEQDEKFELDEAEAGIDAADIDWNAEAAEAAEDLLERSPGLTCDELTAELSDGPGGDGFTDTQTEYGVRVSGAC